MQEKLSNAVTKYAERAAVELARPYDGWGETPEVVAAWWLSQSRKAQELLDAMASR